MRIRVWYFHLTISGANEEMEDHETGERRTTRPIPARIETVLLPSHSSHSFPHRIITFWGVSSAAGLHLQNNFNSKSQEPPLEDDPSTSTLDSAWIILPSRLVLQRKAPTAPPVHGLPSQNNPPVSPRCSKMPPPTANLAPPPPPPPVPKTCLQRPKNPNKVPCMTPRKGSRKSSRKTPLRSSP
jgi:hypothetical protein